MGKRIWRGGMIGAGAWSEVQLTAWAGVENAKIIALCDRHQEKRDPILKHYDIPQAFDDFQTMLDKMDLDFVDICTRPSTHATLVKLAAQRSLPILCQKPFCTNLDEARLVTEYCRSIKIRLMINENFRWQAWYRKAKELLSTGALGKPFLATIQKRVRMTLPTFDHPQAYLAEMPQLITYEVGIHYLDTFRYLFGEPETIFARQHHISPYMQGEDVQLITLNYQNLTGVINTSWASVPVPGLDEPEGVRYGATPPRLEIEGTDGTLSLKSDGMLNLYTDRSHQMWHFGKNTIAESHTSAQQHFIDCLASGAEFETSASETLKSLALVSASYLSAREGRVVDPTLLD